MTVLVKAPPQRQRHHRRGSETPSLPRSARLFGRSQGETELLGRVGMSRDERKQRVGKGLACGDIVDQSRDSKRCDQSRCLLSLSAVLRIWPERSSEYKNRKSSLHSCEDKGMSFGAYLSVGKGEAHRPVLGSHGCLQQANGVLRQQDRQSLASTCGRERKLTLLLCSSGSRLCRTRR